MRNWIKRVTNKFTSALKGSLIILSEEKSLWVHIFVTIVVIVLGIILNITLTQWGLIIFAIGLVLGFEIMNTAIEYLVDITSFEYNTKAKKVKDVAAMATLVATLTAIAIGLIVFIPAIQSFIAASA